MQAFGARENMEAKLRASKGIDYHRREDTRKNTQGKTRDDAWSRIGEQEVDGRSSRREILIIYKKVTRKVLQINTRYNQR